MIRTTKVSALYGDYLWILAEEDTEKANPEVKQIAGGPEQGPEVQAVERTHSHRLNSDARCDFTNDESPTADETTVNIFRAKRVAILSAFVNPYK